MKQFSKLMALALISVPGALSASQGLAQDQKKGTTPYVTHFIFRPLISLDVGELGTATTLEAVGTTQNMKGEKMLDKMSARCVALNVASGDKKYIDGACVLADTDGDKIFSTFDTRDLDKSQPDMNCGTHVITGGTGKYKGITGREPFALQHDARLSRFRWLFCNGHPAQHCVGNQITLARRGRALTRVKTH